MSQVGGGGGVSREYSTKTIGEGLMCFDFCDTIQALLVKAEDSTSIKNNKNQSIYSVNRNLIFS